MAYKLKPVPGIDENVGGELWVKGDNVMLGYMRASNPGVLEPPIDEDVDSPEARGWYATGDVVQVDAENYIFIKDRARRFAKVGGEMVSLAAVENALRELLPDIPLGVVSVPDAHKGEQLVLIIEKEEVAASRIAAFFASKGLPPLWTPKRIITVKEAPVSGSGKFDYSAAKAIAANA
jgi:acyl-[acyl-carrier-protein]-phospholipid O-acyltransferase/long-chain-fatty-acid--[acyl-carrier-protein] ligase